MKKIAEIIQPDDFHVHLRDNEYLKDTVRYSSKFGRIVVMPNLKPPVITIKQAKEYRNRILNVFKDINPLMTLYLHPSTNPDDLREFHNYDWLIGVKLYPAGATTNSEEGINVAYLEKYYPLFELMEKYKIPLMIHGEVPDNTIDFFEREKIFIEKYLIKLRDTFRELKIVLEHVSSKEGVDFVNHHDNIAATVTPQHILMTRNDIFKDGINPHNFCLPVLKTHEDKEAIAKEVFHGNPKFFAGTDSAPHPRHKKESCCGSAGIFSSPVAIELYLEFFEEYGKTYYQSNRSILSHLEIQKKVENFLSKFGAQFYGLTYNEKKLIIYENEITIPDTYPLGNETVVPMWAGKHLKYSTQLAS